MELSESQAHMLEQSRTGHLATADASGAPHVIPICYAFDGESLYSVLDQKPKRTALARLRRVRNIQANSKVALVVDHYEEDWTRLGYVLVSGTAELLEVGSERAEAVELLRRKYSQYRDMDIAENPVIKITPHKYIAWGTHQA